MNLSERLKSYINKKGQKTIIFNFISIIIICLIALITWNTFMSTPKNNIAGSSLDNEVTNEEKNTKVTYSDDLETKLENLLTQIKGVGEVDVMITYESSTEIVPASNTTKSSQLTEEKDSQGGTRTTTQDDLTENIVTTNNNTLVVIKEIKPEIRGVVVVAEGAGDMRIKSELIEAVRTIFQVPAHRVMVYEKNSLREDGSNEEI